jgi:hypothetical protein
LRVCTALGRRRVIGTRLNRCPACGEAEPEPFFRLPALPVHGTAVFATRDEARAVATGLQELCLCGTCGLVFNAVFDPTLLDYRGAHEESQHHSPRFAQYATWLSEQWVARHALAGRGVVEVGCGSGDFAVALLDAGVGRVIGVDPHFNAQRIPTRLRGRLTAVPQFFDPAQVPPETAALVCRHTLEHIADLARFGSALHAGGAPLLLVEVPDFTRILDEGAFWDLHYEHCSNFTPATVAAYLRRVGFEARAVTTAYADQYLLAEAVLSQPDPAAVPAEVVEDLHRRCAAFAAHVAARTAEWATWLDGRRKSGAAVAVWGAGSKGLTFLATLAAHLAPVQTLVDVNPGLQGHFVGGTGLPIVAPEDLRRAPPQSVIVMNPIYSPEIREMLDTLGLEQTELVAV